MAKLEWALAALPESPELYELGFRNVTKDEAERLLLTFAGIQRSRGEAAEIFDERKFYRD